MISIKAVILIGSGCFVLGEIVGIFIVALCSANKRNEVSNEV